jgi:hypothetical protein
LQDVLIRWGLRLEYTMEIVLREAKVSTRRIPQWLAALRDG